MGPVGGGGVENSDTGGRSTLEMNDGVLASVGREGVMSGIADVRRLADDGAGN